LIGVSNQGGFRYLGTLDSPRLIVLRLLSQRRISLVFLRVQESTPLPTYFIGLRPNFPGSVSERELIPE